MRFLEISITKCPNHWGQRPYANRSQRNHPYQGGWTNPVVLEKNTTKICVFFWIICQPNACDVIFCNFLVGWFGWRVFWDLHEFHDWPWWKSRVGFNKTMDELSTILSEHAVTWTWNSKQPLIESYKQLCQLDDEPNLYIGNGCLSISIHF